jgi:hypothetical protein
MVEGELLHQHSQAAAARYRALPTWSQTAATIESFLNEMLWDQG